MKTQKDNQIQRDALDLSRRRLLKTFGLSAAAIMLPSAGLLSGTARAQVAGVPSDLIARRLPKTNEVLPAVGLGTFLTFDSFPGQQRGNIDFVQVRYSIHTMAEERLLPAAADRGVAVLVNMPLEKARLHKVVEGRPLPAFAKELGIEMWSQYFLKWVISHPAVTCALPATTNPDHLTENVAAMRGPLPDREMRSRMARHMESIPGFAQLDQLGARSWYPDKTYAGVVGCAQAELRNRT
jgi:hypothetical protein